jgi:hypothetical protein
VTPEVESRFAIATVCWCDYATREDFAENVCCVELIQPRRTASSAVDRPVARPARCRRLNDPRARAEPFVPPASHSKTLRQIEANGSRLNDGDFFADEGALHAG